MTSFQLDITHSGGTYSITHDGAGSRLIGGSRVLDYFESHAKKVEFDLENSSTTGALNFLSSSCAVWDSGTGAMAIGDIVEYWLYPTSFTTGIEGALTKYFYGQVASLHQTNDGTLHVVAYDALKRYDYMTEQQTVYSGYRDRYARTVGTIASGTYAYKLAFESVDSDGLYPGAQIALLTNDYFFDYGCDIDAGGAGAGDLGEGYAYAQAFIAPDVEILGVLTHGDYTEDVSATEHSVLRFSIREDDGADRPSTTMLFYVDVTLTVTGVQWLWTYFDTTNHTFERLVPGRKYWVHVEHYSTDATYPGTWQFYIDTNGTYCNDQADAHHVYGSIPLDAGSSEGPGNFYAFPLLAEVIALPPTDYLYYLDGATPKLVITKLTASYPGLDSPPTVLPSVPSSTDRGRLSYYYGTITVDDAFEGLIELAPLLNHDAETDIDLAIDMYRTTGKSYGDCLRELCDLFAYNNSGTYNQCVVSNPASAPTYIYQRRRRNTTDDASSKTFSFGHDAATGEEARIISCDLRKTVEGRPGSVKVVGKSIDGTPIIVTRDDRMLSYSLYEQSDLPIQEVVYDPNLTTLSDAHKRAYAILDSYHRSAWEGTLMVDGVYPHLMMVDSESWGSGGIITLNYSPLGISATKFKVLGVRVGTNTTEIEITNAGKLRKNTIRENQKKTFATENYASPVEPQSTIYIYARSETVVTSTSLFAQLSSNGVGTILASHGNYAAHRVPCTKLTVPGGASPYNVNSYYAVFEAENGYGDVESMQLYEDLTGGSAVATYDLGSISLLAQPYKSKLSRVILDFACKAA